MTCTLVTAFYPVKSKRGIDKYIEWGQNLLKLNCNIVLYTIPELVLIFKKMRGNKPITIIDIPFEDLYMWKRYKDKWIEHHLIDHEKGYHSPELYAIWAQRFVFMEEVAKKNYFNSEYLFWCDFGAFRHNNINDIIIKSFPSHKYLSKYKITFCSINPLLEEDKQLYPDNIIGNFQYKDRIAAGLWGGGLEACINFRYKYEVMLNRYIKYNRFCGKEQSIITSICIENNSNFIILKPAVLYGDSWFFFQYLHSDLENIPYLIDNTYITPNISVNIMGGLGNQMFQLAAAYAYSKKYKCKLSILRNKLTYDKRPLYWDSILKKWENYLVDSIPNTLSMWNEQGATKYAPIPIAPTNGLYLKGYYQSSKYYYNDKIKSEIRQLMKPSIQLFEEVNNKYKYLIENKERVIVVHARRTDYLAFADFHNPLSTDYYIQAIEKMITKVKNPIFLLTSDDNNYWNELKQVYPKLNNYEQYILDNETDINSMTLLQQFSYYVMSNSTFIWWCVWLSYDTKHVIVPSKWFGPLGPQEYEDIYEESWERV